MSETTHATATSAATAPTSTAATPAPGDSFWRGFVAGLAPLLTLAIIVTLTLAVTVALSELSARHSFALQQTATAWALGVGLAASLVAYVAAWALALRRVGAWRRAGAPASANGTLWALAVTALLVALPVVIAIALPQHPAP